MFGGLDIKGGGSSSNSDAGKTKDNGATAAAPPPASSAFSFLNLSATTAAPTTNAAMTEHTTAVTSAFSFLSMGADSSSAASPASAPSIPTMSSFSFLQPTPSTDDNDTGASAAAPDISAPSLSSFSFLTSTTSPVTPPAPATVAASTHDDASAMSAFNFLTAPTPLPPVETSPPPPAATSSLLPISATSTPTASHKQDVVSTDIGVAASTTTTSTTSAPASSNWEDHLATSNPNVPAGSGIVFGGAVTLDVAASSKKPIKKRNRVSRVGVGAASGLPPSPPKAPTSSQPTPPPTAPVPAARDEQEEASRRKHREEAEEAQWRAEQFLREKMMESTTKNVASLEQQQQQQSSASSSNNTAVEFTRTKSASSYRSDQYEGDLDEEDDVVAAAKAAAEEARYLSSSSLSSASAKQRSLGDRLGGLFQRKTWGQNSVGAPSLVPPPAGTSWLPAGARSVSETSSENLTAVERIQREQEEIKRAMAERQLVMQQQQQQQYQPQQHQYPHQHHQYPPKPSSDEPEHVVSAASTTEATSSTTTTSSRGEFVPPTPPEPPVVHQPPAPPAPKSPSELFDDIMAHFHSNVQKAMDQVGQLRQQRAMLLEERFVTLAKERLASQQMAQAEAQQQAAAESEDFDLADQMGTVLEAHSRERAELDSILESIGRALEQLETQRVQVVGAVAECFSSVRSRLKKFEKEQLSQESKDDTDAMRKFSTVAKQLSAENERLQQDLKHLERDETLVAEERKELETAISEHSGEHEVQRNEALEKLHHVEEEIEELRRKLAAKEAVAEELRNDIKSQDEAIGKIRVKFSRQLLRVQTKESTLKENRHEWENEKATFERQKESHETEVQEHSQALLKHEELMNRLKNEISLAGTFERIVSKEVGFDELLKDNEETDGELAQMHTEVVKCEAAVSKATDVLKAVNATLSALEEEHKQLISLIPDLESEKKAAAARRDFKAASKASKEIKDATIRLKECLQELTCEAADRKKAAEEELTKLKAELEEKRKTTEEKEKVSGDAAMLVLAQKIKDLIATKKSICGNAGGVSVQGVGAFVLNGQIDSLKMEGQTLGSKYGGWDELLAEIEAIENAEAEEVDALTAKEAAKDYGEVETEGSNSDNGADGDTPEAQEEVEAEPAAEESKYSSEEKIARFKELTSQLKDAEEALEAAVAREDYDQAAELQDVFERIQQNLEALDLTDEEMDRALGSDEADDNNANENKTLQQEQTSESKEDGVKEEETGGEDIQDEKIDEAAEETDTPTEEQSATEPDKNGDVPVNGDSEVPSDSKELNGALEHDAKVQDGEEPVENSSEKAVVADDDNDLPPSAETDGSSAIQESELGVQSDC